MAPPIRFPRGDSRRLNRVGPPVVLSIGFMAVEVDFKTKISSLNPRQREWFATATVAMMLADGNIDRGEMDFILRMIQTVKDEVVVDRLKKFIQFRTMPPLGAPAGIDRKLGMSMVIDLIRVAVADSDFDAKEKEMILDIGKNLGFSEAEMDQLIMYGFELMMK